MSFKTKACYLIGFFCFVVQLISAQDQKLADSLIAVYQSGNFKDEEVVILSNIAFNEIHPEIKLEYSEILIKKAASDSLFDFLHSGYLKKGDALLEQANYALAIESYFESLNYASRSGDEQRIGAAMIGIADTYSLIGNSDNAKIYYNKGIALLRETNDSVTLAKALFNTGDEYYKNKKYDSAMVYHDESVLIFKNTNHQIGAAYNLGNMGMIYAAQGKDVRAMANINEAIAILEEQEVFPPISEYLICLSDIYLRQNNWPSALGSAQRSLEIAQKFGLKELISKANLQLSKLYEQAGNPRESFKYFKNYNTYRDSVNNIETIEQMANLRTNYEVSQKQIEVDLHKKESEILELKGKRQRNLNYASVISTVLIFLLALGLYYRYKFIKKTNRIIEEEKNKSDKLLRNILPEETALELKQKGKVTAKKFESVTVLFTDFKDFTHSSSNLTPENLVRSVNYYFSKFDEIMDKHGLEKIKTMGDAYMCAGGLHFHKADHALKMVEAAFEIGQIMHETKKMAEENIMPYDIRIGIHTGPVVAGVVGTRKFAYDIWGDTVNVASRMESSSEPGKINISEKTYLLVKDFFNCSYRGELEVKNKGMMKMYFVNSVKDETSKVASINI